MLFSLAREKEKPSFLVHKLTTIMKQQRGSTISHLGTYEMQLTCQSSQEYLKINLGKFELYTTAYQSSACHISQIPSDSRRVVSSSIYYSWIWSSFLNFEWALKCVSLIKIKLFMGRSWISRPHSSTTTTTIGPPKGRQNQVM